MPRTKRVHYSAPLADLRERLLEEEREGKPQRLFMAANRKVGYAEALTVIGTMMEDGKVYLPCCDNVNAEGKCLGRVEKETE